MRKTNRLINVLAGAAMLAPAPAPAQNIRVFADSIRRTHHIPALGYAIVSADSILEMDVLGVARLGSALPADLSGRFRIGSNTKAVTGMIAARLVKQGKIKWDSRFFDLYPELRAGSNPAYHHLTLVDMLTFRTRLFRYTYTFSEPHKGQFKGTAALQRYLFTKWFMAHEPVAATPDSFNFSNLGYVAAGLMLEKASGRSYKQLVKELGDELGTAFDFGRPNAADSGQVWGHNALLQPEATAEDYKLEWLLAAGNINCTLPGYAKFIQQQLLGLSGRSTLLPAADFEFLHYGRRRFAVGWFPGTDEALGRYTYNVGNPGSFLSKVYVFPGTDRAFILLANAQTAEADTGMDILYEQLKATYAQP